jgi:proteasome lid subunit RPN8/RPN11
VSRARVAVPAAVRRAIKAHADEARPNECCGLLVGRGSRVTFAVRMENRADSPRRFRLDDRAHITLRKTLRAFTPAVDIVGVYHSHPDGPAEPSPTDLAEAHYAEWVYLIVGRGRLRAFRIPHGRARPLVIT